MRSRRVGFLAVVLAGIILSACAVLGPVEPPDYEPRIQNQLEVPIEIYQFAYDSPDQQTLLTELDPWAVYVLDSRGCTDAGYKAVAEGREVARIDNGYGLCSSDVWKVRGADSIVGDDARTDPKPQP